MTFSEEIYKPITSLSHPLIKETAALLRKKYRDETGFILVEGPHPIEEALKAGYRIVRLFILADDAQNSPPAMKIPAETVYRISERVMAKLAATDSPPPMIAVIDKKTDKKNPSLSLFLAELNHLPSKPPLILVLDHLQDPGNLGTLIRSAKAFDVDGIILTRETVDPWSPKVIRSSAGLVFSLPIIEAHQDLAGLLREFQSLPLALFTTTGSRQAALSYRNADFKQPCVLVFGNEGRGLEPEVLSQPSLTCITIPMHAGVESLNVAVSGSVILAEAAAQRENMMKEAT